MWPRIAEATCREIRPFLEPYVDREQANCFQDALDAMVKTLDTLANV